MPEFDFAKAEDDSFSKSSSSALAGVGSDDDSGGSSWKEKLGNYRSYLARIGYVTFIGFGFILAILLRDGLFGAAEKIPFLKDGCAAMIEKLHNSCFGNYMVYRISFSLVIFFFFHLFLSSRCFFVGDRIRLALQYHWASWIVRTIFYLICLVVPFFIPNAFFYVYGWIAIFLSGIFLIVQVILIIDFAFEWHERWRNTDEEASYTKWDVILVIIAVIFYTVGLAFIVLSFVFFGGQGPCHLQRFFICFQIVHSIILIMASILVQRGVFVPSVVLLYSTFTVWCALMSDPNATCNKLAPPESYFDTPSEIITMVIGLVISGISILRAAVSTGGSFGKLFSFSDPESEEERKGLLGEEEKETEALRDECSEMWYSHLVFLLASAYMATVLTNWDLNPDASAKPGVIDTSTTAMWVKVVSSWITNLLFGWTLFAPLVLGRCRKFNGYSDD